MRRLRAWSCKSCTVASPSPRLGTFGGVLEGGGGGGGVDPAKERRGVAVWGALKNPGPADHAIGQAQRDKAVFELAHLVGGADQDRDLVELLASALQLLDLLAD